jgi:hypothetical protein
MSATCPAHLILLDLITIITSGMQYNLRNTLLWHCLQPPVTSSSYVQVLTYAPCSQTPSAGAANNILRFLLTLNRMTSWTAARSRNHSSLNRVSQPAANRASAPGDDESGGVDDASTRRVRENRNMGFTFRRPNCTSPLDTVNVGRRLNRPRGLVIFCLRRSPQSSSANLTRFYQVTL